MATIYNSSFHCYRIQICETRLILINFYCSLYCLQDLQTLSTEIHLLIGALLLKTVQEISPFPQQQRVKRIT